MEGSQTALQRIDAARAAGHTALVLSGLGLRDLPDALRALAGLRELDLSDNELTVVPPWIVTLTELCELDLRNNRLVEVPWQLGGLDLRVLALDGNPHLLLPPPETVAQGTEAVLAHLRANAPQEPPRQDDGQDPADFPATSAASADLGPRDTGSRAMPRTAAIGGAIVLLAAAAIVAATAGTSGPTTHPAALTGPGGVAVSRTPADPVETSSAELSSQTLADSTLPSDSAPSSGPQSAAPVTTPVTQQQATSQASSSQRTTSQALAHVPAPAATSAPAPAPPPPPRPTTAPAPWNGPWPISHANASGPVIGYGNLCMDDQWSVTTNYNPVQLWGCDGTGAQWWSWVEAGSTLHVLGKCLDVRASGTANGTPVDIYDCNGTGAQVFVPRSDGSLYNPQSNKCLDDTGWDTSWGVKLQIWDCTGNANQQWRLP